MPKNYTMGGRSAAAPAGDAPPGMEGRTWRERLGALRNLPPFLQLVWRTSPALTLGQGVLRIIRALLPVATLYVGKLIIDEVVLLVQSPRAADDWRDAGERPARSYRMAPGTGVRARGPLRRARPRGVAAHLTAAENIAVGRIEARDDRARIVAAAQRSLADEVIAKLPDGYDQVLGKRFRTGIDLSGGEWQKIAIARAYMRDAQLLILDEPTAALDARLEFEVFKRFKDLSEGKTAVLISHRFSSVRMADRIVVLMDGTVEAIGTHDDLLARGGRYVELFELRAAGYR